MIPGPFSLLKSYPGYLNKSFKCPLFTFMVPRRWPERPSDLFTSSPLKAPAGGRVPVFAEFSDRLGVLLGPTGGYLISYPIAAAVAGLAAPAVARAARRRAISSAFSGTRGPHRNLRPRGRLARRGDEAALRRDPGTWCLDLCPLRPHQGAPDHAGRGCRDPGHSYSECTEKRILWQRPLRTALIG